MYEWCSERFFRGALDRYRMLEDQLRLEEQVERIASSLPTQAHLDEIAQATRQAERLAEGLIRDKAEDHLRLQEQIQRTAGGFTTTSYLQEIARATKQAERFAEGVVIANAEASQVLEKMYQARQELLGSASLDYIDAATAALERALSPIGGDQYVKPLGVRDYDTLMLANAFRGLNSAIAGANYLGAIEINFDEEEEDDGKRLVAEELEEQLVEVVPAETLSKLKQVNCEPFLALERILRSPEAMRMLNAREFEHFIATLVDKLGFEEVTLTPRSADAGRDVIAVRRISGIPVFFAFECKRYRADHPVGPETLRALLGTINHPHSRANKGVLVTTSRFTSGAWNFIVTEPALDGKDFNGIVGWLKEYAQCRSSPK